MGCPNMVTRAAAETPNAQACRRAGVQPAGGYKGECGPPSCTVVVRVVARVVCMLLSRSIPPDFVVAAD